MQALHLLFLSLSAVQATKVLLPLYVYPSWQGWWNNIYTTVAANPNITFQIILNPSNGPGGDTPGYNSDWVTGVSKLNSYYNVHTLGYVHTSYNQRTLADVKTDVAAWAGWNTYKAQNISVNGVFFDETPNWNPSQNGINDIDYMGNLTAYAKAQFNTTAPRFATIFNVGTKTVHPEYFHQADYVLVFENYASAYTPSVLSTNVPAGMAAKSSILLHDFNSGSGSQLPAANVGAWLRNFTAVGLGSANILNYGYDQANSADAPADIGTVARILSS